MALGEAFVNVHADLKPFSRDLNQGITKILREAEKHIASDTKFAQSISDTVGKNVAKGVGQGLEKGVSKGLEDGFEDGMKKGAKKAAKQSADFFSTLADFIDDGLSAVPPEIKAAVLIGVGAAVIAILPLLAGTISAAIISGAGIGVAALGVILATRFKVITDTFKALGQGILSDLTQRGEVFIRPLLDVATRIQRAFASSGDRISRIFTAASALVDPLAAGIIGLVQKLLPAIETLTVAAKPIVDVLATALPRLGEDIATAFRIIAVSGPSAAIALRDMLAIIGALIIGVATLIAFFADLYDKIRLLGIISIPLSLLSGELDKQKTGVADLGTQYGVLDTRLNDTITAADATALSITKLTTTLLGSLDAGIAYEEALDNLTESLKKGNHSFDQREDKGRQNLRLVEQLITAASRQRDADLENAARTGQSIDTINAKYESQITQIQRILGKDVEQSQALKDILAQAHKLPDEVSVQVNTPGLATAIANVKAFISALKTGAAVGAQYVKVGGTGLKTAKQFATGGIVGSPTNAIIGEAGYAEAVIPDPAVMPGRAMQLSNQFGLTSMIAKSLGAAQPVVNVFIGSEKLEQIADYRIAVNNQWQGNQLAYGPR